MATSETTGALTPKQQRAVRALLEHKSVGEAAQSIGVGERTLFRWLTDPAFKLALSAAESDLLDAATRRLLALQENAIGTFESLLAEDSAASDAVRLRAAIAVLDYLLKLRELRDVEQRLTTLEQAMAAQAHRVVKLKSIGLKMGRHLQRLAALEQTSAARLPRNDQITLGEWRRWHETGQQPQRWIGNASIQEWVQQALERQRQADETIALFEVAEYEADSAPIAGA